MLFRSDQSLGGGSIRAKHAQLCAKYAQLCPKKETDFKTDEHRLRRSGISADRSSKGTDGREPTKAALCPKIELRDNPPTIPVARAGVPLSPVGNSDDDSRTQESRIAHGVNYPALHGKGCRRTIGFYSNDYLLVSSRALY